MEIEEPRIFAMKPDDEDQQQSQLQTQPDAKVVGPTRNKNKRNFIEQPVQQILTPSDDNLNEDIYQTKSGSLEALSQLESMSIIDLNRLAMHYLSKEQYRECFQLLKQAEQLVEGNFYQELSDLERQKRERMKSLTINNLGCYYKKQEYQNRFIFKIGQESPMQLSINLSIFFQFKIEYCVYMMRALSIEGKTKNSGNQCSQAGTKLNICAILSSQKKHREAIMFAKSAIQDYESLLTDIQIGLIEPSSEQEIDLPTLLLSSSIAFYNLGAEYEHCDDFKQARLAYEKSYMYAMKAPPEVAAQMARESSRSILEVTEKEDKRQAEKGKRLLLRLDAKGVYHMMKNGEPSLSHRHTPSGDPEKRSTYTSFQRPKKRVISLEKSRFETIEVERKPLMSERNHYKSVNQSNNLISARSNHRSLSQFDNRSNNLEEISRDRSKGNKVRQKIEEYRNRRSSSKDQGISTKSPSSSFDYRAKKDPLEDQNSHCYGYAIIILE